jgi:long-chain acyl-CoA synthetase
MLDLPVRTQPDKPAMDFMGSTITFLELRDQVVRMANALAGIGLGKGDRVVLCLPNCPQYMITYYAVLLNGAIVVNANPMYTAPELEHVVSETSPRVLITFDGVLRTVAELLEAVDIPHIVVTGLLDYAGGDAAKDLGEERHRFRSLVDGGSRTLPRVKVDPTDPAQIQFTGGTTGVPKGAVLSHANLVTATYQSVMWGAGVFNLVPATERTVLVVVPYFHVYGNIVGMNTSLLNGSTQIVVPRFEIDEFMELLARHDRITYFPSVPTRSGTAGCTPATSSPATRTGTSPSSTARRT